MQHFFKNAYFNHASRNSSVFFINGETPTVKMHPENNKQIHFERKEIKLFLPIS